MQDRHGPEQSNRQVDHVVGDSRRLAGLRRMPALAVLTLWVLGFVTVVGPTSGRTAPAACGLASAAFCDNFDQGPSPVRGRAGDLDPTTWGVGHLAPSDFSSTTANPVGAAPVPACKASFPQSSVYPNNDTLICDATGARTPQLMTAVAIQNYGNNSYLIRQPFDFANRTGKIVFDVDAVSVDTLAAYVAIDITEDPSPAPTFQEFGNFEAGPIPRNGLMLKWNNNCSAGSSAITLGNTLLYTNYVARTITPSFAVSGGACARTRQGALNHFEIQLSQQHIDIYASDFSTDEGQTYPNFRRIYSADLTMPFTRGYVHVAVRNHATIKYGYGPAWVYHWDNIGFDGPVISDWRAYELPDSNGNPGGAIRNLGYLLSDGTNGKPAGIYAPINQVSSLQFHGVDVSGAVGARLSLNTYFNTITHTATGAWGWTFRFNGGTWRTRLLTPTEVQVINSAGSTGNLSLLIDVPVADLRAGSNTFEMLPVSAPMDYPPAIANVDLLLALSDRSSSTPASPANLRIVKSSLDEIVP